MSDNEYMNLPSPDAMNWDHQNIPMDEETLLDLSTFFGIEPQLCQARLNQYRMVEMAEEWKKADPRSPEEIRKFYQDTELYIWELSKWHASGSYAPYRNRVAQAISRFPTLSHPKVLDFGAGIATASLEFAKSGHDVTIADVPGKTLAYARHRFERRGLKYSVIEVTGNTPELVGEYDIIVSFDVLEHVPEAELVLKKLVGALRVGGAGLIVASFEDQGEHPQHLASNIEHFRSLTWDWALVGSGLRFDTPEILVKASNWWSLPRRLRWKVQSKFPNLPWQFLYR